MSVQICGIGWCRPNGDVLACQYVKGHEAHHSWRTIKMEDEQEVFRTDQMAVQISALLEAVARGDVDLYIEALLAGLHDRKRVRRGVWSPGVPR